ncbi:unnamed protein product, partial [marine sediment metagenome]
SEPYVYLSEYEREADQLSIEALKFRAKVKGWYPTLFPEPLPGETE